ncbi:MAG TPA: hypothetical protein VLM83_11185 [Anaerolineales bacterium]|nr:hypothetical protein [Anaerolineales bacterium]
MYWSYSDNPLDLGLYLLLTACWGLGGWLLARHAFHLRRGERLPAGLALGFTLFISLSGLLAQFLPVAVNFWGAALLVLLAGCGAALRSKQRPWLALEDLRAWPLLVVLLGVTALYTLMLRGQSIFDEYLHLPLISVMAAGDIPPHFYLNPDFYYAYHYGIQVFAASLVRLGGFFPWSAWDISRAAALGFTVVLGWLLLRRLTGSRLGAGLGAFLLAFGGGTRWLLLLLPTPWLDWVSHRVNLVGSGLDTAPTLMEALHRYWVFEGGGPLPLPFAFHNGIFVPANFVLGSTGALPFMIILLLLLLLPTQRFTRMGLLAWSLAFAGLALAAEHWFAFLWLGIGLSLAIAALRKQNLKDSWHQWGLILLLSAVLALLQGGFITEVARGLLNRLLGLPSQSYHAFGFSLRWPPGLPSAHLGSLSLLNPGQLITLAAELGPAVLLVVVLARRLPHQFKRQDWVWSGLALSAFLTLIFPVFFKYGVDRSITRFPATALWTAMLLAFPLLWRAAPRWGWLPRVGLGLGYMSLVAGGVVILVTQLYSLPAEQYTYFVQELDAAVSSEFWNALPAEAQVIDPVPERSVTLFGRVTRAHAGTYIPLPEWEAALADPDPVQLVKSGYGYIYIDQNWWSRLTAEQKLRFEQPCFDVLGEWRSSDGLEYRVLMDLQGCAEP